MTLLDAGKYLAEQAGLYFILQETLELPASSWVALRGDNGVGKTTFLEHVLLPTLSATHHILYLAQDFDLQIHSIRATLGLLNQPVAPEASREEIALSWIRCAKNAEILISDEFDKYIQPIRIYPLLPEALRFMITVSHLPQNAPMQKFAHGFQLSLQRIQSGQTNITIHTLW